MRNRYFDGISIQNHRTENMDSLLLSSRSIGNKRLLLSAVCDGVGSTKDGAFAAYTTIRLLSDWFDAVEMGTRLGLQLRDKVLEINQFITEEANKRNLNTASTLSSLLLIDDYYYIIHLGDSRIYSYENETLRQMTDDDVSEEGKLTSYLGRGQKLIPHYDEGSAYGKQFLLCSDGLYKKLDDNMISAAFRCLAPNNLRQEALNLSRLAIERGERDNISVALII